MSPPVEIDSASVREEQIVEYLSDEECDDLQPATTDCVAERDELASENQPCNDVAVKRNSVDAAEDAAAQFAEVPTVAEDAPAPPEPFVEISTEIDNLGQLLDEELPLDDLPRFREGEAPAEPLEDRRFAVAPATRQEPRPPEITQVYSEHAPQFLADPTEAKKERGPFSVIARNLLAQLPGAEAAALIFTSPTDGEGKTETLLPLAEALLVEESGRRTILVDANLHHPDLTRQWQFTSRKGIFDVLADKADWWEAVQETGLPKLSILLNNGLPRHNAVVARPLAFSDLLEKLKREYRLVVVDAASLAHAESISMVRHCHGVYLIVRLGHSSRQKVREAVQVIGQAGGKLLGCIAVGDGLQKNDEC